MDECIQIPVFWQHHLFNPVQIINKKTGIQANYYIDLKKQVIFIQYFNLISI